MLITLTIFLFSSPISLCQEKIKYAFKQFQNYLQKPCADSFIINPCTEDEISKIMSEFNNNKATGINCIPFKNFKLI